MMMEFTLFNLLNILLAGVFVFLLVRYIYILYTEKIIRPAAWVKSVESGNITNRLKKLERKYPDKTRFFTFWMQLERLKKESVQGAMAELGVYQGESAEVIHQMAPEREFHLFDTFSGFTQGDLIGEQGEAATYTTENFADTTVQLVINRIRGNENVKIHPGYFPQSLNGLETAFAFVNIDCDLYKPTAAALDYFYPRLSPGGVILVHDYNYRWPGILKAVDEFLVTIPEGLVIVPDRNGTAVIVRNK